jgi:hypothetical protein
MAEANAAPDAGAHSLSLVNGILLLVLIVVGIVAWIIIGGTALAVKSFFASFLYVWYWANLEKADFKRIPASVIGALVGVGLAWGLKGLPAMYGNTGTIISLLIVVAALFVQIMGWLPIALNASAMLFLTVLAAPALLTNLDFIELTKAIVGGAAFFAALVYGAMMYAKMTAKTPA